MQSGEKPVTSFNEAVERARRHELHTSRVQPLSAPCRVPLSQTVLLLSASCSLLAGSNASNAGKATATVGSTQHRSRGPHCTYSGCDKPVGPWDSTCSQKARDLGGRRQRLSGASKHDSSVSPRGNFRHRFRRNNSDDNDDDCRRLAGSTNGNDN